MLLLAGCGAPEKTGQPLATGGTSLPDMHLRRFTLRVQEAGRRIAEISGDSAALIGTHVIQMDTTELAIYRENLAYLNVRAPSAGVQLSGSADSSGVSMPKVSGTLYYGGQFHSGPMAVSFGTGEWRASGGFEFERLPLHIKSAAAHGSLTWDAIHATKAEVRAEGSRASGDLMTLVPQTREIRLTGHARFESDSESLRGEVLLLRLDPTFSRLMPAGR